MTHRRVGSRAGSRRRARPGIGRRALFALFAVTWGSLSLAACGQDLQDLRYAPPPGAPYEAENVTVSTPLGLRLTGTLTVPSDREAPVPAVVTITGSGRQDRDEHIRGLGGYRPFRQVADTLGRVGIATLRLDDRGVNGSDRGPAGATSFDFADDIRAALAYLRTRPEIDGGRLALVGHSEGGMIAPVVAATDSSLAGIVLMAGPAYTLRRINGYQRQQAIDQMPSITPEQSRQERERTDYVADLQAERSPWRRAVWNYDPLPTAREVAVPVLILHGQTDRQISPEQADTLAAAFREGGNPDVTVRTFPDTNHLFLADSDGRPDRYGDLSSPLVRRSVLGALADWLVARLEP